MADIIFILSVILLPDACGIISVIGHNVGLNKFKNIKIRQSIFTMK